MRRLIVLLAFLATPLFAATHYAGRPLADALRDLESKGLRLIFNSDVVRPEMTVSAEPAATEPRRMLDELLREHHLHATKGPRGSLVIVRDDESRRTAPAAKPSAMPIALDEIVVTPSSFTIFTREPDRSHFLSREEVRSMPHLSDDLYRALDRLPGITGSDITARFNVRGGKEDETEVLLDGAEVYDPFHVRDLFRAFSTIDAEAIGAVDVLTGGFPSQYGGRLSGVIDISSMTPPENHHTEIGVSLLNTRVLSAGTRGNEQWLLSVRRGYLRELLKLIDPQDEDVNPNYYDLLAKLQTTISDRNVLSFSAFIAGDTLRVRETETDAKAIYTDRYLWANLRSAVTPQLFAQTVATIGRLSTDRRGTFGPSSVTDEDGVVRDERAFDFLSIKNDSTFDVSPRNLVKAGGTIKQLRASYDYSGTATIRDSLLDINGATIAINRAASLHTSGGDVAVYAADRIALTDRVVVEIGARADRQSYAPDGVHFSPRLNAVFAASNRVTLRAAWGRFFQPQGVQELQVEDGVTSFFPAERADHALIGADFVLGGGFTARAELYEKRMSDMRPRFENIYDRVVTFPELRADRLLIAPESGSARGGELLLRREGQPVLNGWLSYSRASVRDKIAGRDVPRSWDQRDSVTFNLDWRLGSKWNFDLGGIYHSGWPTTPLTGFFAGNVFHTAPGPLNSSRLPSYRRVDLRVSRHVQISHGGFSFFLELMNVLNVHNVTRIGGYNFTATNGVITGSPITESVLGVVPSFGVTYAF
jgi:hypothetical protein